MKRTILINVLIFLVLVALMEGAARIYIAWTRGSQTAGMAMRTTYLTYKPFVMFGRNWNKVLAPERFPQRLNVCRVMLVGGSTAAHFPIDILANSLSAGFEGRSFEVINAASGGYNARQEVIVASLWGPKLQPDLLLSLDGANDLIHRIRMPSAGSFYLNSTYELYLTRPFLSPLVYLLTQSQLYNGINRLVKRGKTGSVEEYSDAIPVFVDTQESLNVIAKGMGAKRMMVLQPYSAFKTPLSRKEAAFKLYKYREEVVKKLYVSTAQQLNELAKRDNVSYLDTRFIYSGETAQIFTDDVHLTKHGYQILADKIVNRLAKDIGNSNGLCTSAS